MLGGNLGSLLYGDVSVMHSIVSSDASRKLSAGAAEEQSSILVRNAEDSEIECAYCLKKGKS